ETVFTHRLTGPALRCSRAEVERIANAIPFFFLQCRHKPAVAGISTVGNTAKDVDAMFSHTADFSAASRSQRITGVSLHQRADSQGHTCCKSCADEMPAIDQGGVVIHSHKPIPDKHH